MLTKLPDILRLALDQELKVLSRAELIEHISDDDLEVDDEALVFEFMEKWVGVDPKERGKEVHKILEHVRFPFCVQSHSFDVIEKSPMMQSRECLLLILEAKNYNLLPDKQDSMPSARTKPRKYKEEQLILFDGENNAQGKCWYYDPKLPEWKEFSQIPVQGLCYFKVCISGNDIILTGGRINRSCQNCAWAFGLSEKKWRALQLCSNQFCRSVQNGFTTLQ